MGECDMALKSSWRELQDWFRPRLDRRLRREVMMAQSPGSPKSGQFRDSTLGILAFITSCSDLQLEQGLKRTCSSLWELSNNVSHFTCTRLDRVDSQLFVLGSQIGSLTPGPSFNHNLCCRCPNGSCEAISDIYISRPFQRYKKKSRRGVFTSEIELWSCKSPGGLQLFTFGSVSLILTLTSKWGCDTSGFSQIMCRV
jgi:hypothetical protein